MIIHQVLVTNQDSLDPGQDQNLVRHRSGAAERGLNGILCSVDFFLVHSKFGTATPTLGSSRVEIAIFKQGHRTFICAIIIGSRSISFLVTGPVIEKGTTPGI